MHAINLWHYPETVGLPDALTDIDETLATGCAITPGAIKALGSLNSSGCNIIPIAGSPAAGASLSRRHGLCPMPPWLKRCSASCSAAMVPGKAVEQDASTRPLISRAYTSASVNRARRPNAHRATTPRIREPRDRWRLPKRPAYVRAFSVQRGRGNIARLCRNFNICRATSPKASAGRGLPKWRSTLAGREGSGR